MSNNASAIPFLIRAMQGTNAYIRQLAVQFTPYFADRVLIEQLSTMLYKEKIWFVRLEIIRAIGKLKATSLQKPLQKILFDPQTIDEEKTEAIIALVKMYDTIDPNDWTDLLESERSESRILACRLASRFELQNQTKPLLQLLNDYSPNVKAAALQAIAILKIPLPPAQLEQMINDPSAFVSLTACWVAALQGKNTLGVLHLKEWMKNSNPRYRAMAAATLAHCGSQAASYILEELDKNPDIVVKINLALGLIGERIELQKAGDTIYDIMQNSQTPLLIWDEKFHFPFLVPSRVSHIDQIPNYPTMVDQMIHLELLNILSIIDHPKAEKGLKNFTKNKTWKITGTVVSFLIEDGEESSMNIAKSLLEDPDPHVSVQAAFILAIMGKDRKAITVLQKFYPFMDRDTKIQILEAIAKVGDIASIPFLISILHEPFQLLRIVAAAAIIQCLYN
jgi:HEAT repeat protein